MLSPASAQRILLGEDSAQEDDPIFNLVSETRKVKRRSTTLTPPATTHPSAHRSEYRADEPASGMHGK